jgi:hypothetical protein
MHHVEDSENTGVLESILENGLFYCSEDKSYVRGVRCLCKALKVS